MRDYAALLHVSGEYEVKEMLAVPDGWITGRTLGELRLRDEGVLVLGIVRADGSYLGVPTPRDTHRGGRHRHPLGARRGVRRADRPPRGEAGDEAHARAVAVQHAVARREGEPDARRGGDR